ncbi:MAG: AAA family ATPase [Verrucomicrobia bacterium]|nr:AAA family ATPase [Verrucomicrobiota bacterium]
MIHEVKIECTQCKAHYLVDEAEIPALKCLKCGNVRFIKLDAAKPPSQPQAQAQQGGIRSLLGMAGVQAPPSPAVAPKAVVAPQIVVAPQPAPAASNQTQQLSQQQPGAHVTTRHAAPVSQPKSDAETISRIIQLHNDVTREMQKIVGGQKNIIQELLAAILCGGHCIVESVPGFGKPGLAASLARVLSISFKRIHCTPDLTLADVTGTETLADDAVPKDRKLKFMAGPIFAHVVLAEDIGRTPPKIQATIVEAMQSRQLFVGGVVRKIEKPFFLVATQNPHDAEIPHPLSEIHLDQFLFKVVVGYPAREDEANMVRHAAEHGSSEVAQVCSAAEVLRMQEAMKAVPLSDAVIDYANRLVRATRPRQEGALDISNKYLSWGAGPSATVGLAAAAKCFAAMEGRLAPNIDDVIRAAKPVLRHRISLNTAARADAYAPDTIIEKLVSGVPR